MDSWLLAGLGVVSWSIVNEVYSWSDTIGVSSLNKSCKDRGSSPVGSPLMTRLFMVLVVELSWITGVLSTAQFYWRWVLFEPSVGSVLVRVGTVVGVWMRCFGSSRTVSFWLASITVMLTMDARSLFSSIVSKCGVLGTLELLVSVVVIVLTTGTIVLLAFEAVVFGIWPCGFVTITLCY